MSIDGVFLHFLIAELKPNLITKRIQKAFFMNESDMVFLMSSKTTLIASLNQTYAHLRLTQLSCMPTNHFLTSFLKKHIEGALIVDILQHHNDRIITLIVHKTDELGYVQTYHLIFELTGRSANLIITNQDHIIVEALKKSYLSDDRIIQNKAPYTYLTSHKANPFLCQDTLEQPLEGTSPILQREFLYRNSIKDVLNSAIAPVYIKGDRKNYFYVFDLHHLEGTRQSFSTISGLLDYVFVESYREQSQNHEQKRLMQHVQKEINKAQLKHNKQLLELQVANKHLDYEKTANLLAAHIHLVKRYQEEITVNDFETNAPITIKLNTNIAPNENINFYFQKFKKAKRTIVHLSKQIEDTLNQIHYLECLKIQADDLSNQDLKEILYEVGLKKVEKKQTKPNILILQDANGNRILVGKNNTQNEYITHTLANKHDYFFHVLHYPGSHVIFQGILSNDAIVLAATIAAYYSKAKGKVSVDYTPIKWVKKVKGRKGSFVTYTNQKTVIVEADKDYIDNHTKK